MKRLTIIALIVLLIAGLFVACDQDKIVDDEFNKAIDITSETRSLVPGNTYRTLADTTIKDRITIDGEGSVTIILKEGTTLTAEKGINVTDDQELQIEGTGSLVATGDPKSAGIGGGEGEDSGTIVIQGGEITANGGSEGGAGIGGGKGGNGGSTIIQKLDGKSAPNVTTKGGNAASHGIGNGDGATGAPEDIELDGVGLESSDDELTWFNYDEEPHYRKQYMRTFDGAIITFNANGGTGDMAAQVVHVNKDENLKANTFTRAGMDFKGWNTKADGSGTAYANMASININADITLYAQWETAPTGNYITAETTTIQSGLTWTIQDNVVNPNRIVIEGSEETTILLPAGLKLTVERGIHVSTDQTLIIDGTGELVSGNKLSGEEWVPSDQYLSGIGDDCDGDRSCVGTIIINGGTITATGGWYASGIEAANCEINGGEITAKGGKCGSGIGGWGSEIVINDGYVEAIGIAQGAGIGGSDCSITINDGEIHASSVKRGAGIGGGFNDDGKEITINGGTVYATGGEENDGYDMYSGAGIGGGSNGCSGTITITGGTITATAGSADADGIGRGKGSTEDRDINCSGVALFVSEDGIGWSPYTDTPRQYMKTVNVQLNYITSSTTALEAGKIYTIAGDVTNNNRIAIEGTAETTILLPLGKTLTIRKGITVADTNSLTIDGTGTLMINNVDTNNSGIGGDGVNPNAGTIIIKGGVVNTTGGENGAGIGGGNGGSGGTINISGGKITSEGGNSAACIGGGYNSSSIGEITITGGEVKAWFPHNGGSAGIGGGNPGTEGRISISGGKVIAEGCSGSAGIGSGEGDGATPNSIVITISGDANVTATGGSYGAGIGGGNNADGGTISIQGGTIGATGGSYGAGIGGGQYADGGTISIQGGTIVADGRENGAGIGGGSSGSGGSIEISGGTITATGGSNDYGAGAGIGGGNNGASGTITISGGSITATGGYSEYESVAAAGIGGGDSGAGGTIKISGGSITATGGYSEYGSAAAAGIGGGDSRDGGTITITGGTVTATGGDSGVAGIGGGKDSPSNGTLTIGENPTTPYTDGKLRIASGWALNYGESSASESIGGGTYDSWSGYAKKYMNVTQPSP